MRVARAAREAKRDLRRELTCAVVFDVCSSYRHTLRTRGGVIGHIGSAVRYLFASAPGQHDPAPSIRAQIRALAAEWAGSSDGGGANSAYPPKCGNCKKQTLPRSKMPSPGPCTHTPLSRPQF